MAEEKKFQRNPNGIRFKMTGINTVQPVDTLGDKFAYLENVRAYTQGRITARARQTDPVLSMGAAAVHSLRRMNDQTPDGPPSGYALIGGSSTNLYCNAAVVDTGFSGNPLSLIPFRPDASPQPWCYVGDSNKMVKVRSDGLTYKTGVKEPQAEPNVGTETTSVSGTVSILGTARPWSNVSGANPSFNYGDNGNGTGSTVIATPVAGASVFITASGTAVVDGVSRAPGDTGPVGASNPGQFITGTATILMGAWTDSSGNIVSGTGAGVVAIGFGATLVVPIGATRLQLGMDGTGGSFAGNTGSFTANYTITTSAVTTAVSTIGDVTAYYWGDSPHSGPVATYIWKNPSDAAGSGPVRTTGDAAGSITGNSFLFDTTPSNPSVPVQWDQLDQTGAVISQKTLFEPALESQGYQDFNVCVIGSLFIPAAGDYTFTITSKDNVMWGIGNNANWPSRGSITGSAGQTMTVLSKCPLLPSPTINGTGAATSVSVLVSFPGPGTYPIELDWDYWYHSGRTLTLKVNGIDIVPLGGNVKSEVSYRYIFRSSLTGAKSNPSPASAPQEVPSISNTITPEFSTDPQVDKVDYYRMDAALDNFTYVGTGPNTNPPTPFTDQLLDQDVASNPLLEFDNYEPFPSIDLPMGGVVDVIGGEVFWVSGDQFNVRWLPGTVINIGGIAYALYNRPSSTTQLRAVNVADGLTQVYEIAEPILAAQPMASLWGYTDNVAYYFACGDILRPGTLYFTKGNNPDSAPQTNQIEVTNPSEPLVNGVIANGTGMVFSAENGWLIYPNFSSALATVTGVSGTPFTLIRSGVTRGLYIRSCICTDGSGSFFYRSKDGIEASTGGGKQQSLSDADLFNLFPHEGYLPSPITIGDVTIFPPDDSKPEDQRMHFATGYLYYDYRDTSNVPRTLVLDVAAGGWVVDSYATQTTLHVLEEGTDVNGILVGCTDGSIRNLSKTGTENATAKVYTSAMNGGDARSTMRLGDIFLRAGLTSNLTVQPWASLYQEAVTGFSPTVIGSGGGALTAYIIDFTSGDGVIINDIAMALSWTMDATTFIDLWQPDWIDQPENTQDRPTDWSNAGYEGNKLIRGLLVEMNTFNSAKALKVQRSDDEAVYVPREGSVTAPEQNVYAFTFPPFTAHLLRIITTDGVPWQYWGAQWIADPWPEYATLNSAWSNLGTNGAKYLRGLVIPMDTNGTAATFTVITSDGQTVNYSATTPSAQKTQVSFAFVPPIIAHEVQIQSLTKTAVWDQEIRWDFDPYPEIIPEYTPIMEINGPDAKYMQGIKIICDTAGQNVPFQVLYDGGQLGPTLVANANGKQTLVFSFDPPFIAHDVQIVPQGNMRIWTADSEWVSSATPDAGLTWYTQLSALGGQGWQHIREMNVCYSATAAVTMTLRFDPGAVPASIVITLPSTGGVESKTKVTIPANKFKLASVSLVSTAPVRVFGTDFECKIKSWGSTDSYRIVPITGDAQQPGARI